MPVTEKEAVKIHGLRRLVRDLSLHTARGDGACAGQGSSDTGTLLMSHSHASTALESWDNTAGMECCSQGMLGLGAVVHRSVFHLLQSMPRVRWNNRALCEGCSGHLQVQDCLWVPVCDIHRQSAENVCKLQEACELCPSQ